MAGSGAVILLGLMFPCFAGDDHHPIHDTYNVIHFNSLHSCTGYMGPNLSKPTAGKQRETICWRSPQVFQQFLELVFPGEDVEVFGRPTFVIGGGRPGGHLTSGKSQSV